MDGNHLKRFGIILEKISVELHSILFTLHFVVRGGLERLEILKGNVCVLYGRHPRVYSIRQ